MWTDIRQEIERARQELGLAPEQFRPVGVEEWSAIQRKVDAAFRQPTTPAKRRPLLWTQLRPELSTAFLAYAGDTENALPRLLPLGRVKEPVFFFVQAGVSDDKIWWYQTDGAVAWKLLEHLWQRSGRLLEYGVVDRKYRWALFVNHADDIIFCGQPLVSQVLQLGTQVGVRIS